MKLVFRSFFFHILSIIVFTIIYLQIPYDFHMPNKDIGYIDFVLLTTTVQVGVGLSETYPLTFRSKLFVTIQQWIMLLTHIITIYIFTL